MYQVDAFTNHVFGGNSAAVCPLENWLSDETMQNIALENNLAETAFIVKEGGGYHIRWFTPNTEVDLCGHATLATAYVLFEILNYPGKFIAFPSRSGVLTVAKENDWYTLNFPVDKTETVATTPDLAACFNTVPLEIYKGATDYMFVFKTQEQIETIQPNLLHIAQLPVRGIIVTSPGRNVDFVSRFFAPACGINEDPVTGSAHTTLTPYWSKKLNKESLIAQQISSRIGNLKCNLVGNRVEISGQAAFFMEAEINI